MKTISSLVLIGLLSFDGVLTAQQKDTLAESNIKEVIISRKVFHKKNDRFVFDIGNAPVAKGINAFELLKQTPMVSSTDDKTLQVTGKSKAVIYINGKKTHMDDDALTAFLKGIPAENIKTIEVITVPGSEFNVESTDAVINIVLKKRLEDGVNGNIGLSDQQSFYNSPTANASLNFRKNKLGINANVSTGHKATNQWNRLENGNELSSTQTYGPFNTFRNVTTGHLDIDYQLSSKSDLALTYNTTFFHLLEKSGYDLLNILSTYNAASAPIQSFTRTISKQPDSSSNHSFNLNYELKTDYSGSKLELNSAYLHYSEKQHTLNQTFAADSFGDIIHDNAGQQGLLSEIAQNLPRTINNFSAQIQYTQMFKNNWSLVGGINYDHTKTDNNLQTTATTLNPTTGKLATTQNPDHFIYTEKILGLYLTASKTLFEKMNAKVGLRVESTNSKGHSLNVDNPELQNINRKYDNFLPYVNLNYTINPQNGLSYAFSSRVQRPSFWMLNPVRQYISQYNYTQNNPFVKAASTFKQELTYMYKNTYFAIFSYTKEKNNLQQIPLQRIIDVDAPKLDANGQPVLDPNTHLPETSTTQVNELRYILTNFGSQKIFDLTIGFQKALFKNRWNLNMTIDLSSSKMNGSLDTDPITGDQFPPFTNRMLVNTIMITANNAVRLDQKKTWFAGLNFLYASKQPNEMGTLRPMSSTDLSIKKLMDNWTFSAKLSDLFNTMKVRLEQPAGNTNFNRLFQDNHFRALNLSITYSFGNKKLKKTRKIDVANEDIEGRTK